METFKEEPISANYAQSKKDPKVYFAKVKTQ
jgi:hypothetical protein